MEKVKSNLGSVLIWTAVATLLSQNVVIHVTATLSFEDQKNYYPLPDPHAPGGSSGSPPQGHTPSHGSGTPPSHGTPSHGGGGSYNPTPPSPSGGNCETPPHGATPSTPSTPSGGGRHTPPTYSGGSPPTPVVVSPPITTTPTPSTPSTPSTPIIPTPPFLPDPNSPIIGTCNYWRTHPGVIWGLVGWWGTSLGSAFGLTSVPGFGTNLSLQQALSNTRTDGLGALYREGTASFLNSMVSNRFPFTTKQVRQNFVAALGSNKAAASQAHVFKLANEGRLKPRT